MERNETEILERKRKIAELLAQDRQKLLMRQPFVGSLIIVPRVHLKLNLSLPLDLEDIEKCGRILTINRTRSSSSTKHVFVKGQVLYSKLRPYLQKVLVAPEDGCCTSEIIPITFYGDINPHYAVLVLNLPYFLDYVMNCCCGVKMPRVTTKDALNALFPLPPLAEQKRIVAEVERLLELGEKLKT